MRVSPEQGARFSGWESESKTTPAKKESQYIYILAIATHSCREKVIVKKTMTVRVTKEWYEKNRHNGHGDVDLRRQMNGARHVCPHCNRYPEVSLPDWADEKKQ